MHRAIHFIESKSSDVWKVAQEIISSLSAKANTPINEGEWFLYINDKRWDKWSGKVKPRSKILVVRKSERPPELDIVKQEDGWIVLNKPANLPTQATLKNFEDNLYERVRHYSLVVNQFPKDMPYVGLHHRLDRGTSGLVLMTLKKSFNKEVSELFKNRKIQKEYLCYTEPGEVSPPRQWLQEDFIARGSVKKKKFFFQVSVNGDKAISEFELIERVEGKFNLIRCRPKTGRTHQLRVQLAHRGYPILGDWVYGRKETASRLMLHACHLKFKMQGKEFQVSCPPDWEIP